MVEDLSAVTGSVAKVGGQIAVVVAPERAMFTVAARSSLCNLRIAWRRC
jgi:hypothetical protein